MNLYKICTDIHAFLNLRELPLLKNETFLSNISNLSYSELLKLKTLLLFEVKSLLLKELPVPPDLEWKIFQVARALNRIEKSK